MLSLLFCVNTGCTPSGQPLKKIKSQKLRFVLASFSFSCVRLEPCGDFSNVKSQIKGYSYSMQGIEYTHVYEGHKGVVSQYSLPSVINQ